MLPGLIASCESLDETSFMELLSETEDHEILECKIIKDLITFSWDTYGYSVHYLGAFIHFAYIITFSMHIKDIYMYRDFELRPQYCAAMAICLIYPAVYDNLQMFK